MHVCIDYRPALREGTGVGTYVRSLLAALLQTHPEARFSAFSSSWRDRLELPAEVRGAVAVDVRLPVRALDWLWHRHHWPPVERWAGRIDIAHSPSPLALPTRGGRSVVTVHDCHFLRHPEDVSGVVRRDYVPLVRRAAAAADAVVVVSETTRDEVRELLNVPAERLHVTYNGVDPVFGPVPDARERVLDTFGLDKPYLMFAGRREPRKDLPTLLTGFAALTARLPDHDLVLVGPDGPGWEATWDAVPPAVRKRIHLLDHQPGATLAALYGAADVLLLTSRWEGFGLTAVEAMACGTPVVAARAGALPEVLADAAAWFEPGDIDGLAAATEHLITDADHHAEMATLGTQRASRYTWQRTAERTWQVYEALTS